MKRQPVRLGWGRIRCGPLSFKVVAAVVYAVERPDPRARRASGRAWAWAWASRWLLARLTGSQLRAGILLGWVIARGVVLAPQSGGPGHRGDPAFVPPARCVEDHR